jgi:hypothetical protein
MRPDPTRAIPLELEKPFYTMKKFKPFALAALLVAGTASASPPTLLDSYFPDKMMITDLVQPAALSAAPLDMMNIVIENRAFSAADLFLLDAPPDVGWSATSTEIDEYNCNFDFSVSSTAVMWVDDPDVGTSASVIKCFNVNDVDKVIAQSGLYLDNSHYYLNANGANATSFNPTVNCSQNNGPAELSARIKVPQPVNTAWAWRPSWR